MANDSFKEDSFKEDSSEDSFIEDSFVADEPVKKKVQSVFYPEQAALSTDYAPIVKPQTSTSVSAAPKSVSSQKEVVKVAEKPKLPKQEYTPIVKPMSYGEALSTKAGWTNTINQTSEETLKKLKEASKTVYPTLPLEGKVAEAAKQNEIDFALWYNQAAKDKQNFLQSESNIKQINTYLGNPKYDQNKVKKVLEEENKKYKEYDAKVKQNTAELPQRQQFVETSKSEAERFNRPGKEEWTLEGEAAGILGGFNKAVSDMVVKPFAGAAKVIGDALGIKDEMLSEKIYKYYDKYAERNQPQTLTGQVVSGVTSAIPLIAVTSLTGGSTLPLVIGSQKGLNNVAEGKDFSEGALEGVKEGLAIEAMGMVGRSFGEAISKQYNLAAIPSKAATAVGMGGAFSIPDITKSAIDSQSFAGVNSHEALQSFLTGAAFEAVPFYNSVKENIKEKKYDRAQKLQELDVYNTIFQSPNEVIRDIVESPVSSQELYAKAIELSKKENPTKEDKIAFQTMTRAAGGKQLIEQIAANPEYAIDQINTADLTPQQKSLFIDRVNAIDDMFNADKQEANNLAKEIKTNTEKLNSIPEDSVDPIDDARNEANRNELKKRLGESKNKLQQIFNSRQQKTDYEYTLEPPILKKFSSYSNEKYGTVNRNDGKGLITLTKEEFLNEQANLQQPMGEGAEPTATGTEAEEVITPTGEEVTETTVAKTEQTPTALRDVESFVNNFEFKGNREYPTIDKVKKLVFKLNTAKERLKGLNENAEETLGLSQNSKEFSYALKKTKEATEVEIKETEYKIDKFKREISKEAEANGLNKTDVLKAVESLLSKEQTPQEKNEKEPTKTEDGKPLSEGVQGVRTEGEAGKKSTELRAEEEVKEVKLAELPTKTIEAEVVEEKVTEATKQKVKEAEAPEITIEKEKEKAEPKAETKKPAELPKEKEERLSKLREKAKQSKAGKAISSAVGAVVSKAKEALNWAKQKEGVKEVKISARNTDVTQAAKDLKEGRITNEEYRAIVSGNSPIAPVTKFFEPATGNQVANSVDANKKQNANKPIEEDRKVALRIDIPAFRNNNIWVISVHDGLKKAGEIMSYKNVARITDVVFGTQSPKASLDIAAGAAKTSSVGRIFGDWKNFEGETEEQKGENAKKLVEEIANDPAWVQVGMNPFRHSYFYDRSNDLGRPVLSADEVVQIGGLVYAKNVKYGDWNSEAFRVKGMLDKAGKPVYFSKKPKEKIIASKTEIENEIIDAMNDIELVNEGIDLSDATTKQKIDVDELNSRLDTPLKAIDWEDYEGIPFGFTISDQLRSGDVENTYTGETIKDLKGGIGFNGTEGNQDKAWANTTKEEADSMHNKANSIYENNKPLFEKLWAEGKLPEGVIPFSVVKMAETSILSNEAVFRVGIQNIETLPKKNREIAVVALKKELTRKIAKESADLKRGTVLVKDKKTGEMVDTKEPYSSNTLKQKKKAIGQYNKILDTVNKKGYKDIVDVLKNTTDFALPEKAIIANEIFYGSPTPIGGKEIDIERSRPSTPVSLALIGDKSPALINIAKITDMLTEPSMKDVPNMHIVSIIGVKVAEKTNKGWKPAGGSVETNHLNYKFGVEGESIGVLKQPVHMKDAFGEAYGSTVSQIVKNEAEGSTISAKSALSQGVPVQSGLPNRTFISAIGRKALDNVDKLSGFLRQVFPSTTFFTSQEAWEQAMADPEITKKLKDGDVIYAFTKDGNIFINPNLKTTKAALHETGHIWMDFMKDNKPELWQKGLSLVEGTKELKDAIAQYGDNELAREEALMEIMSSKGENIVNAAQKAKIKEWLLSVWKYVSSRFKSLQKLSPEEVQDLTLDKFVEGVLSDILSGRELVSEKVKGKGKTKFSLGEELPAEDPTADFVKSSLEEGYTDEEISTILEEDYGYNKDEVKELIGNAKKLSETKQEINKFIEDGTITQQQAEDYINSTEPISERTGTPEGTTVGAEGGAEVADGKTKELPTAETGKGKDREGDFEGDNEVDTDLLSKFDEINNLAKRAMSKDEIKKFRELVNSDPSIKEVHYGWKEITNKLIKSGELTKSKGCP